MGVHWETPSVVDQLPPQTPEAVVAAKLAEFGVEARLADVPQQVVADELIRVGGTQWNRDFAALSEGLKAMDDRLAMDKGLAGTIKIHFPEFHSIRDKTRQLACFEAVRDFHDSEATFLVEVAMRPEYNGYRQEHEVVLPVPGELIPEARRVRESIAKYRANEDDVRKQVTQLLTDPEVGAQVERFVKDNPDIGESLTGELSPRAQLKIIELITEAPRNKPAPAPEATREIIDLATARAAKAAKATQTFRENVAQLDNRRKAGAVAAAAAVSVGLFVTPTHNGEKVASPTNIELPQVVKVVPFQPQKPAVIVSAVIKKDATKPWGDQSGPAAHEVAILEHMEAHKNGNHSLLTHKNHPAVKQLITSVHAAADQYAKLATQSSAHDELDKASVQFLAIALKGAIDNPHSIPHSLAQKALDTSNPFHVALTDANVKTLFPEGQELPVPLSDEYKRMVAGVAALAQQAVVGNNQAAGEALAQQVATVRTQAAQAEVQSSAQPAEAKVNDPAAATQPAEAAAPPLQAAALAPAPTLLVPNIQIAPASTPDSTGEQTPSAGPAPTEPTPSASDTAAPAPQPTQEQTTEPTSPAPAETTPALPPKPAPAPKTERSGETGIDASHFIAFIAAEVQQESGGKWDLLDNPWDCSGGLQISNSMWNYRDGVEQAGQAPEADQIKLAISEFEKYYKQFDGDWKDMAIAWYAGPGFKDRGFDLNRRQNDGKYPSLNDYGDSVMALMERYRKDPSSIPSDIVKYMGENGYSLRSATQSDEDPAPQPTAQHEPAQVPTVPNADTTGFTTVSGETYGPNPSVPYALHGVKHYSQHDHRWADKMYSIQQNPDQDISASGCEPSSMAMVISTLTDKIVSPVDMAKFALEHGFRTDNSGTVSQAIPAAAETYGLQATQISNASQAISAIQNNTDQHVDALIILDGHDNDPATPPTKGGHYYVISQVDKDGKVWVNDPNSIEKTLHSWDLDQLVAASNSMWVVSR